MVAIGGGWYSVSGTSASAPVVAGMFSLINAARIAQGKTSLGWVNPTLYSYYRAFTNDIKSGKNNCVVGASATSTCCSQGYYATPGWDPATGLGSLNFLAMKTLMTNLGPIHQPITSSLSATKSPSVTPTKTPSKSPTVAPTAFSTGLPTVSPTKSPTLSPTNSPTMSPAKSPTMSPTKSPTMSPTNSPRAPPTKPPTKSPVKSPTKRPTATPTKFRTSSPTVRST